MRPGTFVMIILLAVVTAILITSCPKNQRPAVISRTNVGKLLDVRIIAKSSWVSDNISRIECEKAVFNISGVYSFETGDEVWLVKYSDSRCYMEYKSERVLIGIDRRDK